MSDKETAENAAQIFAHVEKQLTFEPLREMMRRTSEWFAAKDAELAALRAVNEQQRLEIVNLRNERNAIRLAARGGSVISDNVDLMRSIAKHMKENDVTLYGGLTHEIVTARAEILEKALRS